MNDIVPAARPRNLGAFIYRSLKDDLVQSVALFFSPFLALKNDFLNSASILKTFEPSVEPTEVKATATLVADAIVTSSPVTLSAVEQVVLKAILAKDFAEKQKLAWRTSVVDLMKALDLDSSLQARKQLAKELGYEGDTRDSASLNNWLHRQIIQKLAERDPKLTKILGTSLP